MKFLGLVALLPAIMFSQVMDDSGPSRSAAPQLHTAPARGSIDSGGYSAPAAVKARSALTANLVSLQIGALKSAYCVKGALSCGLDPSKAHDANTIRLLAMSYLRARKPADALELALHAPHANPFIHDLAGIAAEMLGQTETAEQQFRSAAKQEPTERNIFAWGAQLLLLGRSDRATEIFTNAISQNPGSVLLHTGLGASLYSDGHISEALNTLLKAAEHEPSSLLSYPLIASIAEASSGESLASLEPRLKALVQRAPKNPMACFVYALSLQTTKQDGQMEAVLKRAILLDPALAQAHFRLAIFYAERGEYARAIPEYQEVTNADPELAEAHYRLGQAYMHTGQTVLAQQQFKQHQTLRAAQQNGVIDIAAVINRDLEANCGQAASRQPNMPCAQ